VAVVGSVVAAAVGLVAAAAASLAVAAAAVVVGTAAVAAVVADANRAGRKEKEKADWQTVGLFVSGCRLQATDVASIDVT
jgi:invasion protein IalB